MVNSIAVDDSAIRAWAEERGLPYFAVSACTREGVSELVETLVGSLPRSPAENPLPLQIEQAASAGGWNCC
jgi:hypothetical protein